MRASASLSAAWAANGEMLINPASSKCCVKGLSLNDTVYLLFL